MDERPGDVMGPTDIHEVACPNCGEPLIWYGGIERVRAHFWCAECLSCFDEDLNEIGELL